MNGISNSGWVPLARLLRPQGRRGELLAEPLTDLPGIFATPDELVLASPDSATPMLDAPTLRIEDHWFPTGKNAGRIVLKLSGCDSISAAEALAGQQLLIAASQLPALDSDTFFVGDLVGCTLYNASYDPPQPIGSIVDVEFATAPDGRTRLEDAAPLLAVQLNLHAPPPTGTDEPAPANAGDAPEENAPEARSEPEPVLIPFVRAWLESVDVAARRITMHLPEGLLDTIPPSQ